MRVHRGGDLAGYRAFRIWPRNPLDGSVWVPKRIRRRIPYYLSSNHRRGWTQPSMRTKPQPQELVIVQLDPKCTPHPSNYRVGRGLCDVDTYNYNVQICGSQLYKVFSSYSQQTDSNYILYNSPRNPQFSSESIIYDIPG